MRTTFLQTASRHLTRWRRPLLWVLGGCVVMELLVNGLLATGALQARLNRSFERMSVEWDGGWSIRPDHLHVGNLRIRRQEPNGDVWELQMESAEVNLAVLAIFQRRLEAESVEVQGLSVRLQLGEHPAGTGRKPRAGPEERNPWTFELRDVRVHEVRELVWGNNALTGITGATGELELVPGQRLTVRDTRVRLGKGELRHREKGVAHIEEGTAGFGIDAKRDEDTGGFDVASGLEGRLQVTATLPSLTTFQRWVPQLAEAELEGGAGRLEADVRVKEGRLAPESRLEGSGEPITVPVGLLRVRAPWRVHGEVRAQEHGPALAGLRLVLEPVKLEGKKGRVVETSEVTVSLETPAPRLGEPVHDVRATLHAARSDPLDLRMLNDWLGPAIQVESGHATLEASTRAHPGKGQGTAHLQLLTEDLQARWGGMMLGGHVTLDVDARTLALHRTTMTFEGSRLMLRDVSVQTGGKDQARHWDGTLSFTDATVTLSPAVAEGRFQGSFSNAAPFIALLTDKTGLPRALSPLLDARNLELSGEVTLASGGAKVEKLRAKGEGLELRGRAEFADASSRAVLLVKVGLIPVGVEVTPEGTHVQVLRPYKWYEQKTGERTD